MGDGSQGSLIGAALASAGPSARIAFVRDRTQFAQTTLQQAAAALTARGPGIVLVETFAGGDKDFSALAGRIKAANITHIALAAFPSEAMLLLGEIRKSNPNVQILATDQLADANFGHAAGSAADGVRVALAPDSRAFPGASALTARMESRGFVANRPALASYAATQIMAQAISTATTLGEPIEKVLGSQQFATILGRLSFDASGTADVPSHVFYEWRNGQLLPPKAMP